MPTDKSSSSRNQSNEDNEKLLVKLSSIVEQMDNINTCLNTNELNGLDDADLSVRLDYIEGLYTHFEQVTAIMQETASRNMDNSIRSNFITTYFEVKAKIKRKMNNNCSSRLTPHSSTVRQFSLDETMNVRKTRLPELKIPRFSGSYTEWPDFFAMFTTVIANDTDLTKIEKFQHLHSCLTGAALDTITSLEPTEENYDKAIALLKNRFDNKLLNFQAHVKVLFGLKGLDKCSATSLRQLSDKLNAHMRALETMCSKEQIADGLLVHLEEGLQTDQLPTSSALSTFLERRCRILENLENSVVSKTPNQQISKKQGGHIRNVLVSSTTTYKYCYFCDSKEHYISHCTRFTNLTPTLRFKEVKRLNLCLNCLKKGHRLSKCKSGTCRYCSMKHHSLLHMNCSSISSPEQVASNDHLNEATNNQTTFSQQCTLISSEFSNVSKKLVEVENDNNVFLATAIVMIKNNFGTFVPCRAILDSASQLNFISNRLLEQLQLKAKKSFTSISGIGNGNFLADKSTSILVKSCYNEYLISFNAVVVPTITGYQPNANLDANLFKIPDNLKLADPQFNKRGKIDILIGASLFFELMDVGQCILWRDSSDEDIKIYKLDTVTYGTKPAAFLAIRTMHQLALDEENNFPIGAHVVKNNFYVDDLITGAKSADEVTEIRHQHCLEDYINWKFIPPRSPHFGGLWEAAVKSAKYHFYRTVGQSILTFDELRTLTCQISAILNSRPLCPISESPDDLDILTPAHFLIGSPLTAFPEPDLTELNTSRLSRYQRVTYMQQVFWKKWSSAYLSQLQERTKWQSSAPNLQKGMMVLVKDENTPPLKWPLGRILDLIPGKDGIVRVAVVKTCHNTFRRAISKLAVLPLDNSAVESHSLSTGGGCSL
ncbi:hypothetical protein EVAR_66461_1 [Eumeta japonica]|uniref:CCHC-type domain-containing protein n=1 Tax=Eumeta variegata TaxID=151549 RepID=A0A4C1SGN1_EUMVA|nr:hypothetical protein EVAR_66461_1 [Eumeta japonica]